jgi:hypothetical protein
MTNQSMKLRGSLAKLQKAVSRFYALLQQRFEGNILVSESWASMGSDLDIQSASLKKLPPSFWQSLKKQEAELLQATQVILPEKGDRRDKVEGLLQSCFVYTLDIEEPMILRVYAPLIRRLRVEWTDRALDFYVMVKAHIARLARLVQAYSGDPLLSQRCAILFQSFEKEVQEPKVVVIPLAKPARKGLSSSHHAPRATVKRRPRIAKAKPPARSMKTRSSRAKPLVKKIEISRRRARR